MISVTPGYLIGHQDEVPLIAEVQNLWVWVGGSGDGGGVMVVCVGGSGDGGSVMVAKMASHLAHVVLGHALAGRVACGAWTQRNFCIGAVQAGAHSDPG